MSLQTSIGALLTWVLVVVWLYGRPVCLADHGDASVKKKVELFEASTSVSSCLESHAVSHVVMLILCLNGERLGVLLATAEFPKVFAAHALFPFRQCVGWGPGMHRKRALPVGRP